MFSTKQVFVLLLVAAIATACIEVAPPSDIKESIPIEQLISAPVNVTELELSFQRSDPTDIVYALNEVKKTPLDYDVIQKVSCAYTVCNTEANAWSWKVLAVPIVRVNLIDVLVQANYRGIDTVDQEMLKTEVVEFLSEPNPLVVQRCLMILSYLDNPKDIPLIENVAKHATNDVTFRVAIIALQLMSSSRAKASIDTILQDASGKQRRAVANLIQE